MLQENYSNVVLFGVLTVLKCFVTKIKLSKDCSCLCIYKDFYFTRKVFFVSDCNVKEAN